MPNLNLPFRILNEALLFDEELLFRVLSEADLKKLMDRGYFSPSDRHANITAKEHVKGRINHPRVSSQFTSWSANYYTTRFYARNSKACVAVIRRTPDMVDACPFSQACHEFLVTGDIAGDRIVALYERNELDLFVCEASQRFERHCGHLSEHYGNNGYTRRPIFLRSKCTECHLNDLDNWNYNNNAKEEWIRVLSDMECQQNDFDDWYSNTPKEEWILVLSDMELFGLLPELEEHWMDCLPEDNMNTAMNENNE
ncbi:hypothetical protein HDU81_005225 [Chytriomyces hyalinus]|nr:hypothetical protein HDU81_005225 [Chytriomyces hyalinus]